MGIAQLAFGPFVHRLNPLMADLFGLRLCYYGLAYALGFAGIYGWFSHRRKVLGWTAEEVVELSICFAAAVLIFGRAFAITFYQWGYYSRHLGQLCSWWRGGMASHGVLIGGLMGPWIFCRLRRKRLLVVMDEIVIPAAVFLAMGRVANFINGAIIGTVTDAWWGVKFPSAEGFRHPVTLYESTKNLLLVPILLLVRRRHPPGRGKLLAHFILWWGFLRLFADVFREHGREFLGIGRGQYFNVLMAAGGLVLL